MPTVLALAKSDDPDTAAYGVVSVAALAQHGTPARTCILEQYGILCTENVASDCCPVCARAHQPRFPCCILPLAHWPFGVGILTWPRLILLCRTSVCPSTRSFDCPMYRNLCDCTPEIRGN